MKAYKIVWKAVIYGESVVEANSKEEARKLALEGKDRDFEELSSGYYDDRDWEIEEIIELE